MAIVQYVSFAGTSDSYGEVPIGVLGGASVFTIEAKISTDDTKNRSNYYLWGTIAGREISGSWKDDWSFCVNDGKLCFWARPVDNGSTSTYRTYSEAIVNDGKIHEVAVRSNADGSIDLFCDGQNVAHQDGVNAKITDAETMLLAFNRNTNSELAYQLYELRCWNIERADEDIFTKITGNESGLQAWYVPTGDSTLIDKTGNDYDATLYNVTYAEINSLPVSLFCDVSRKVQNANRTWIYTNVGTADTLINGGTTLTNLPITQSKTGCGFYQTEREKCFDISAAKEIWLKFDVYFDGINRWRAYNGGSNGTTGITAQTNNTLYFWANDNAVANFSDVATTNQLQTVLLHMISGMTDGIVEAWIDGNFIYRYIGNVNHGQDFADIYLQSDGSGTFFSNVIISNVEIGLNTNLERVTAEFDVKRTLRKSVQLAVDVSRRVLGDTKVNLLVDVKRKVVRSLNIPVNVARKVYMTCEEDFDIAIMDVVPVNFSVDVERQLCAEVNLLKTNSEEIFQGKDRIEAKSVEGRVKVTDNPARLQSLELNLAEQQLTDQITFTTANIFYILQYIAGQYFDYQYRLRIESMTKQGALFTYRCCSNLDKLLYTQCGYMTRETTTIEDDSTSQSDDTSEEDDGIEAILREENNLIRTGKYHTLKEYAQAYADTLASWHGDDTGAEGLKLIARMGDYGDFYSSIGDEDVDGRTQADIIREIFGWTSRIPHKMINFYNIVKVCYLNIVRVTDLN